MSTKLVAGAFTPSVLLAVARRLGLLQEHGIDVREVLVPSSPAQFRALLDDDLDVAFTSPDNVIAYRFCPDNPLGAIADVSVVSGVDRGLGLALYGRPGVENAGHLRGAVLGVDVPTSGFALAMYALTDSLGVGRDEYQLGTMGSTPKRLKALLAGDCAATMLNAGNELLAEQAGCTRLAAVADVCTPYLGTVVSIAGTKHLTGARALAAALWRATGVIRSGQADDAVRQEAESVLALPGELAVRYLGRLKDSHEGLVSHQEPDLDALATVLELRLKYLPTLVDGVDLLGSALDPGSGLITAPAASS